MYKYIFLRLLLFIYFLNKIFLFLIEILVLFFFFFNFFFFFYESQEIHDIKPIIICWVNYIDTPFFGETKLATPYFGEMTFHFQICKIINTSPIFFINFFNQCLTNQS